MAEKQQWNNHKSKTNQHNDSLIYDAELCFTRVRLETALNVKVFSVRGYERDKQDQEGHYFTFDALQPA